jgi:hypothetical protein
VAAPVVPDFNPGPSMMVREEPGDPCTRRGSNPGVLRVPAVGLVSVARGPVLALGPVLVRLGPAALVPAA